MEAVYTNPVLNVFIHLLMAQIEVKLQRRATHASCNTSYVDFRSSLLISPSSGQQDDGTPLMTASCLGDDAIGSNKVARRRWHLIYTLLRNPELIKLRKGFTPCTDSAAARPTETP